MQGLILAAGRGSRMGNYHTGTPKCLLEVGGRHLIEHQLESLAEAGVAPVAAVVGYSSDEVRRVLGIRADCLYNARWETTNSIYSFWLARDWIKGPVLILNSDVLFHPRLLSSVLAVDGDAIAYDSSSGSAPEHMKVRVLDSRLVDMGKKLPPEATAGENVGLIYLTAETAALLLDKAGEIIAAGGEQNWLGSALREVARVRDIRAVDVAGLPWGEVDNTFDLERLRGQVWPAIRRTTGRVGRRRSYFRGAIASLGVMASVIFGLTAYRHPAPHEVQQAASWEAIGVRSLPRVALMTGGHEQVWSSVGPRDQLVLGIDGPGPLRVESRLLFEPDAPERVPYILKVELDGQLVDLYKKNARREPEKKLGRADVGRRKRVQVDLTPGRHTLSVSLLSGPRALLRVLQADVPRDLIAEAEEEAEREE